MVVGTLTSDNTTKVKLTRSITATTSTGGLLTLSHQLCGADEGSARMVGPSANNLAIFCKTINFPLHNHV
jgi:hypothetical protein